MVKLATPSRFSRVWAPRLYGSTTSWCVRATIPVEIFAILAGFFDPCYEYVEIFVLLRYYFGLRREKVEKIVT